MKNLPCDNLGPTDLARITEIRGAISDRLQQLEDGCVLAEEVCNYSVDFLFMDGPVQMVNDLKHIMMGLGLLLQKNSAG